MSEDQPLLPLERCLACDDLIYRRTKQHPEVEDAMRVYCRVCALEILGISVPYVGPIGNFGTGGGRRVIKETKTH